MGGGGEREWRMIETGGDRQIEGRNMQGGEE